MTMTSHIYMTRGFKLAWFRVNRLSGCWFPVSTRFQELLSCPWVHPLCPYRQMTIMLHTYMPRRLQWTCFGVNWDSGCRVSVSARFQGPLACQRACPLCPTGKWSWCCTSTGQDGSINFFWSKLAQWLLSSDVRKIPWALIMTMGMPFMPMGKWQRRCTSTDQDGSNALDMELIEPVVAKFRRLQDSRGLYHAQGMPIMPPWANNHNVAHLQANTWFGMNRPSGYWVPASARIQGPSSCPWTCPLCPYGQMTNTLHKYRPTRFQLTWFGVNRANSCCVPVSARFQGPLSWPRACPLWPMGQQPWRGTSTCLDGFNELDLKWIGRVVTELQHPQSLVRKNKTTDTNERAEIIP